jgi:hypothetical protein
MEMSKAVEFGVGSIVTRQRPSGPHDPNVYEVIRVANGLALLKSVGTPTPYQRMAYVHHLRVAIVSDKFAKTFLASTGDRMRDAVREGIARARQRLRERREKEVAATPPASTLFPDSTGFDPSAPPIEPTPLPVGEDCQPEPSDAAPEYFNEGKRTLRDDLGADEPSIDMGTASIANDAEDGIECIDSKDYGGARRAFEDIKDKAEEKGV